MPRKKRNLEKVEQIVDVASMTEPPLLMTNVDLLFWYGLLEEALDARANAPIKTAPARSDEGKSEGRRWLESYIAKIAFRIKDAPPPPVLPLLMPSGQSPVEARPTPAPYDNVTASELLQVLRRKLGT